VDVVDDVDDHLVEIGADVADMCRHLFFFPVGLGQERR
jgi:hypothetical protein